MANIIKALRNLKGYNQEQVASALGISLRAYHTKEKNPDNFRVSELRHLAKLLEVDESIFFENKFAFSTNKKEVE